MLATYRCPNGEIWNIQIVSFHTREEYNKVITPLLQSHYLNLTLKSISWENLIDMYNCGVEPSREYIETLLWNEDKPVYRLLSLKRTTCHGCLYDLPGQNDHMGEGGCLCENFMET